MRSDLETTTEKKTPPHEEYLAQIPYTHITDKIRLLWGSAECDLYLNSLLITDRNGSRAGFPPEVSRAIFTLINHNELFMRSAGHKSNIDTLSGLDWASETGKWKIIKSLESKVQKAS